MDETLIPARAQFASGFGYWLFAIVAGGAVCGGYVLLGAAWLALKSEGELRRKAIAWARWGLMWVALAVALVSTACSAARRRAATSTRTEALSRGG
jgi:cytochrome bd ubiquinol oxidase subunit II